MTELLKFRPSRFATVRVTTKDRLTMFIARSRIQKMNYTGVAGWFRCELSAEGMQYINLQRTLRTLDREGR